MLEEEAISKKTGEEIVGKMTEPIFFKDEEEPLLFRKVKRIIF